MPNHFHFLVQEKEEGGVSNFMQKLGTSFCMYFNNKHDRIGNVFIKPFRSKHILDDRYLGRVKQYIHLNAAELFEPEWKRGKVHNLENLEKHLKEYEYSSIPDYYKSEPRIERNILDPDAINFLREGPPLVSVLEEAREYYLDLKY
jgi:putative transposase